MPRALCVYPPSLSRCRHLSKSELIRQILTRDASAKPGKIISELAQQGVDVSKDLVKKVRLDWRRSQESINKRRKGSRAQSFALRSTDFEALRNGGSVKPPQSYRSDARPRYGPDGPTQPGRFFSGLFIKNFSQFLIGNRMQTIEAACATSSPAGWFQTEAFAWLMSNRNLVGLSGDLLWQVQSNKRNSDIWIQYAADYESRRGYSIDVSLICNDRNTRAKIRRLRQELSPTKALPNGFDETNTVRLGLVILVYRLYAIASGYKYLREAEQIVTPKRFQQVVHEELADVSEFYGARSSLRLLGKLNKIGTLDNEPSIAPASVGSAVWIGLVGRTEIVQ